MQIGRAAFGQQQQQTGTAGAGPAATGGGSSSGGRMRRILFLTDMGEMGAEELGPHPMEL